MENLTTILSDFTTEGSKLLENRNSDFKKNYTTLMQKTADRLQHFQTQLQLDHNLKLSDPKYDQRFKVSEILETLSHAEQESVKAKLETVSQNGEVTLRDLVNMHGTFMWEWLGKQHTF